MSFRISIASPPDRDFLVAEIMKGNVQVAEVNIESGKLEVEIYNHPNGKPWQLDFEEFLASLNEAQVRLIETVQR